MSKSNKCDFFGERNSATRIEIFDELSESANAALRVFFRRMGAPHLMDEAVLPLMAESESQILAAVRDRPWPPWGLGARNVVAVLQTHLVTDGCWAMSPVYVADEDLTNVGLSAALYKEALETLAVDPDAEVHYLVADGSFVADRTLRRFRFERSQDVFVTESARYLTYRTPVRNLLGALGLADVDTVDVLAHVLDEDVYERNAVFHGTIYLGSRAEWQTDRAAVPSELARLVSGGHFSLPASAPTGTPGPAFTYRGDDVVRVVSEFLTADESEGLLEYILAQEERFGSATVVGRDTRTPTVNERVRRSSTLGDLGRFEDVITRRIKEELPEALAQLKCTPFPIGPIEVQATVTGDGGYFRIHRDSEVEDSREMTFVYFLFAEPRKFSGGELRVFDTAAVAGGLTPNERSQTIVPRNNLAVFFPSRYEHEVLPVRVPSGSFADSRFSVTGWVHRQ